jgi:hypothetical protein
MHDEYEGGIYSFSTSHITLLKNLTIQRHLGANARPLIHTRRQQLPHMRLQALSQLPRGIRVMNIPLHLTTHLKSKSPRKKAYAGDTS